MMDAGEMYEVLQACSYRDWTFFLGHDGDQPWLQVRFMEADLGTGGHIQQYGRKWRLSRHMTRSELVQTAFLAVLTAVEHEAREGFRYRGRMVFGPHLDVDALAEFVGRRENLSIREPAEREDEWADVRDDVVDDPAATWNL